jgi:hypothetical protein
MYDKKQICRRSLRVCWGEILLWLLVKVEIWVVKWLAAEHCLGKIWGHWWCKTEELIKEYASSGNVRGQWLTKLKKNRRESLLHRTEYSNEGKDELAKVTTSIPWPMYDCWTEKIETHLTSDLSLGEGHLLTDKLFCYQLFVVCLHMHWKQ